jgi:hypothetical protein
VQRGGERNPVPFTDLDVMKDDSVKVVILEGPVYGLSEQLKSGQVAAVVTYRQNIPEADFESPPPDDMSKAFPMRFVLITPETLHQYSSYFPR